MKTIVIDYISKKDSKELISELMKNYVDVLLHNCQEYILEKFNKINNKSTYTNGNIYCKIFSDLSFTLCLKEETIYVFVNNRLYTKQLMSLKLLRKAWEYWCKEQMFNISDKKTFERIGETNRYIRTNTSIKYILELREIGINTKSLFT